MEVESDDSVNAVPEATRDDNNVNEQGDTVVDFGDGINDYVNSGPIDVVRTKQPLVNRRQLTPLERIDLIMNELLEISSHPRKSMLTNLHMIPSVETFYDESGMQTFSNSVKWMAQCHHFYPIIIHNGSLGRLGRQFQIYTANIYGIPLVGIKTCYIDATVELIWNIFLRYPERYKVYNEDGTHATREQYQQQQQQQQHQQNNDDDKDEYNENKDDNNEAETPDVTSRSSSSSVDQIDKLERKNGFHSENGSLRKRTETNNNNNNTTKNSMGDNNNNNVAAAAATTAVKHLVAKNTKNTPEVYSKKDNNKTD